MTLVLAAACSGGDGPVIVGGPGPAPDEPPGWHQEPGGGNPFDIPTGSSGGGCLSCADVVNGASGDPLCPGVEDELIALGQCICGVCIGACANTCQNGILDQPCMNCASAGCGAELNDCF